MSLESIAALPGHHDLSMTMVYARIADRTVAEEYFAVTEKVEALYGQAAHTHGQCVRGAARRRGRAEHAGATQRDGQAPPRQTATAGVPASWTAKYETICESCSMFFTTIAHRDTRQAQRNDAAEPGHNRRRDVYDALLTRLDETPT